MNKLRNIILLLAVAIITTACGYKVTYNLSGGSIPPEAQTFSVAYFPNNAPMVAPTLSNALTEGLRDKFSRQTRLQQVEEGGDFAFEGEITNYASTTASVSSGDYALQNRLTITVKVRFTNNVAPEESFEKTYTAYQTFDSSQMLVDVQDELCNTMITEIADQIYNDTVAKW